MAQQYYTLLTTIGQSKVANAIGLGNQVLWTHMAVGDGNGNPTFPSETQTALVRERYRAQLNQVSIDPQNPNYIVAEMIIPANVGGWIVHEIGIYDDDGDLVVAANFPETYKPQLSDGSGSDLVIRLLVQVSNASAVTIKIDPAVTLASRKWVTDSFVQRIWLRGGKAKQVLAKSTDVDEDFKWQNLSDLLGDASTTERGLVRLANSPEAQALIDDKKPITPNTLAAAFGGINGSMKETDFQMLPNGLMIQWGLAVSGNNGDADVVFTKPFPNAILRAIVSEGAADSWAETTAIVYGACNLTRSGMTIKSRSIQGTAGPVAAPGCYSHWLAIGK